MKDAVQAAVDRFAAEINTIALKTAAAALGNLGTHKSTSRTTARSTASATKPRMAGRRAPGEKRDPAVIEAAAAKFTAYVTEHPGQNIETISKAINVPTHELQVPVKKQIAAGEVKTFGARRATRYFPKGVRPTKAMVEEIKAAAAAPAAE